MFLLLLDFCFVSLILFLFLLYIIIYLFIYLFIYFCSVPAMCREGSLLFRTCHDKGHQFLRSFQRSNDFHFYISRAWRKTSLHIFKSWPDQTCQGNYSKRKYLGFNTHNVKIPKISLINARKCISKVHIVPKFAVYVFTFYWL